MSSLLILVGLGLPLAPVLVLPHQEHLLGTPGSLELNSREALASGSWVQISALLLASCMITCFLYCTCIHL